MNIYMLTGDNQLTANAIASELGIEAIGEVLPQDKEKHVRELQEKGHRVIMVGDGETDGFSLFEHFRQQCFCRGYGIYDFVNRTEYIHKFSPKKCTKL